MKMGALSEMLCLCLLIGAVVSCGSGTSDFSGSKAVTYDLHGYVTEYEYGGQGSLVKMTVSADQPCEHSVNTHLEKREHDIFGNVLREMKSGVTYALTEELEQEKVEYNSY